MERDVDCVTRAAMIYLEQWLHPGLALPTGTNSEKILNLDE
jgi:hypothetical protein